MTVAGILLAGPGSAVAGQTASTPIQATEQSASIHGVVVNSITHQPVARALVQVDGHSILTAHDGKFEFSGLSGTTTTVRVTKPGFYEGLDPNQITTKAVAVGLLDEIQVKLYPEALITGTLSAANGDPLAQVQVQAMRQIDNEWGSQWTMAAVTNTNADGQFRLPLPGGEYVLETQYKPDGFGRRGAILPLRVPAAGSHQASTLRLASGTEQHLDLHPAVRPSHAVHLLIDGPADSSNGRFGTDIQVHLADGLVISPQSRQGERPGEVVVNLPNGSYLVSASGSRTDDGASYGETQVTVANEDVSGVTIHLQKALELPIEASVDPASSAGAPDPGSLSFAQQTGIFLQKMNGDVSLRSENVFPTSRHGGPAGFTLMPGTYRLRSQGFSRWFIESATAGGTDLLTQELVVDGGSSSLPLRLVVSNQMAAIKGTTKLGGQLQSCSISMIAAQPGATPIITASSGSDGGFSRASIPPGSYRVVASEMGISLNLSDPAVERLLAPYMKTVTVGAGETGSVDLDAVPASEATP